MIFSTNSSEICDLDLYLSLNDTIETLNTLSYLYKFRNAKKIEICLGFFYMGKYDHSELESKERESINVKTEWNF